MACVVLLVGLLTARAGLARPAPWATGESRGEDLVVELVSFGPGDAIHQVFGHAALLVRDRRLGDERLYNYGMFRFGPDMISNYVQGRLMFWVGEQRPHRAIDLYVREDRQVVRQRLRLSPPERASLAQHLAHNVLPDNREYLYHHYDDNCATRLADAIDRATRGEFKKALSGPGRLTFRQHTRRYLMHRPLLEFLTMHVLGGSVDRPITRTQELFLPDELQRAVHRVRVATDTGARVRLESRRTVIHRSGRARVPLKARPLWPHALGIGLLIAAFLPASSEIYARRGTGWYRVLFALLLLTVGGVFGLLGTLTAFLSWATDHDVAHHNENVLLASPLMFGLCVASLGVVLGRPWWRRWVRAVAVLMGAGTGIALVLKLIPSLGQDNSDSLALLVPVNASLLVMAFRHQFPWSFRGMSPTRIDKPRGGANPPGRSGARGSRE